MKGILIGLMVIVAGLLLGASCVGVLVEFAHDGQDDGFWEGFFAALAFAGATVSLLVMWIGGCLIEDEL
jgi:hypothetical protein